MQTTLHNIIPLALTSRRAGQYKHEYENAFGHSGFFAVHWVHEVDWKSRKKKSECHFASELGSVLSGEVGGSTGTVLKENEWLRK